MEILNRDASGVSLKMLVIGGVSGVIGRGDMFARLVVFGAHSYMVFLGSSLRLCIVKHTTLHMYILSRDGVVIFPQCFTDGETMRDINVGPERDGKSLVVGACFSRWRTPVEGIPPHPHISNKPRRKNGGNRYQPQQEEVPPFGAAHNHAIDVDGNSSWCSTGDENTTPRVCVSCALVHGGSPPDHSVVTSLVYPCIQLPRKRPGAPLQCISCDCEL